MKRGAVGFVLALALVCCGTSVFAAVPIASDDREASFLPPPAASAEAPAKEAGTEPPKQEVVKPAPVETKPASIVATKPQASAVSGPAPAKPAINKTPVETKKNVEVKKQEMPSVTVVAQDDLDELDGAAVEAPMKPVVVEAPATPAPGPAPTQVAPVNLGAPVASTTLAAVDADSVGLLEPDQGGLGATMWKGTTRELVDRFLLAAHLPNASPTLNRLAKRLLLSDAAAPVPTAAQSSSLRSLTSLRVEKLLSLGDVDGAWKLAAELDGGKMDDITMRLLVEAALVGSASKEVCAKLPDLIAELKKADENNAEWQKSLILCQYQAGDMRAVQLGLDLLREEQVKDDLFLTLMNKNVLGGSKQLPRQMTPLRPITLAVLRQLDVPLPPELYARPQASIVPELLRARAADGKARLALAEKAAGKGLLSADQLAEVYKTEVVTPAEMESALTSSEPDARVRAALYQTVINEAAPQKRIDLTQRFLTGLDESVLTGALGKLAADMIAPVQASADLVAFAPQAAHIFALAGRPERAMAWLRVAQSISGRFPEVGTKLAGYFPIYALSGLVPEEAYAQGLKDWFRVALAPTDAEQDRIHHEQAGQILVLLSTAGFAIPEEAWLRVIDVQPPTKQHMPSVLLLERLQQAAQAGRKGEVVLLALLLSSGESGDTPMVVTVSIVRALRQIGMMAEAQALAREAIAGMVVK